MATRDEVKDIMYVIANEYPEFIPANKQMATLKVNTWFNVLKNFQYYELQNATMNMLMTFVYGTPKIAHLMGILKPPTKNLNEGMEFAIRLINLSSKYGTEKIGQKVIDEFGEIGYSVYRQIKSELRELKVDDENTFKAQIRTLYNSLKEKEDHNVLENLPYQKEAQELIEKDIKHIANKASLAEEAI